MAKPGEQIETRTYSFRRMLLENLSYIYAMLVVMCGFVIYTADVFLPSSIVGEVFTIYLTVAALLWLVFLYLDVRSFVNEGPFFMFLPKAWSLGERDPQDYIRFSQNAPTFFFKFGASVFALGHIIHQGLLLGQQAVHVSLGGVCVDVTALAMYVLQILLISSQVFVLFKFSNIIINCRKCIAQFGLMHQVAASLCFGLWHILRESKDSLMYNYFNTNKTSGHSTSCATKSIDDRRT